MGPAGVSEAALGLKVAKDDVVSQRMIVSSHFMKYCELPGMSRATLLFP